MPANLDQDPVSFYSKTELDVMGIDVSKMSVPELQEALANAKVLQNNFRTHALKEKPIPTTVYGNANTTMFDMLHAKRSATGMENITKKATAAGKKEAESILEKFSQNYYGDKILRDSQGLNPLKSISDYEKFEAAKPLSVTQAETIAQNQEQFDRLQDRVGTTTPDPGNKPIYDLDEGYLGNFKNQEAALQLLKTCIPCEFRKLDFSAEFSTPWANTLKDLNKKWKDLLKMLRDLSVFKPGEFSADLCNLFKFLDGQCIPDITGLLSLLSMMQIKYLDLSGTSLTNIINQLISPFLTPIIGSFTSNLDQYAELIIGPLRCVSRALEQQIVTLQEQINGAVNIADMNRNKFRQAEVDFYDAKIKSLRKRKLQIEKDSQERKVRTAGGSAADVNLDGNVLTPSPYPSYKPGTVPDFTRQERIVETKLITGGIRIGGTQSTADGDKGFQLEIQTELDNIDKELDALNKKKIAVRGKIAQDSTYSPTNFNGAISITRQSQLALDNFERSFKSIIGDLTDAINDGINIVKQSIDIYREEFQRLLLGRVTTQQDQIEFTRMLQKIMRLVNVVQTVNQFKNAKISLKKFCEQGADNALNQVVKGLKGNDTQGMFDFYNATDSEGNPLILIAPGGAKVSVSSIEFDDIKDDALFADASFDLDAVTKTVTFNDLNEVDQLNRQGITPNLGNIDSKKIELSNNFKVGSELDLHFKTSYAIISNEFCSKSAINFGSSDTVKQWASSLWQKN